MVGDKDLNIYMEGNSNPDLNTEIWSVAKELGYSQFIPTYKYDLIDDHIPFIQAGIRAVDVIDFDYPYWHTTNDTLDKVSAESLQGCWGYDIKMVGAISKMMIISRLNLRNMISLLDAIIIQYIHVE